MADDSTVVLGELVCRYNLDELARLGVRGQRMDFCASAPSSIEAGEEIAVVHFTPEFAGSGIEIAPLTMPLSTRPYSILELDPKSFHGLPGLLADSLPASGLKYTKKVHARSASSAHRSISSAS